MTGSGWRPATTPSSGVTWGGASPWCPLTRPAAITSNRFQDRQSEAVDAEASGRIPRRTPHHCTRLDRCGPPAEAGRSDEFKDWVEGLRGLMEWAGFVGTFGGGNTDAVMSSDDEEWGIFLDSLYGHFGQYEFLVRDIVDKLRVPRGAWNPETGAWSQTDKVPGIHYIDPSTLPGDRLSHEWDRIAKQEDVPDSGFRKSLGHWCRNHAGRWAGDLKLVPDTNRTLKQPMYAVFRKESTG